MGHGILLRARVDSDRIYYLERCGVCRGVWLDRGEWQRLAAALYLDHLDDLWDPAWQKQRRSEKLQITLDSALLNQLGPELYRQLRSLVTELSNHPAKAQALAWITTHLEAEDSERSS
jgi:Zn-finger nucleic acid-binding protein